mgnify:CR=1 FL=1
MNFTLVDAEIGELGKIEDVIEFPQQEMAVISHNEKEVFIPLHESLIEKLNFIKPLNRQFLIGAVIGRFFRCQYCVYIKFCF